MNTQDYVRVKKIDGLELPRFATPFSAGYDIVATSGPIIVGEKFGDLGFKRIDYIQYHTQLFIAPPPDTHVLIHPRSSISKYNLILKNSIGLCDSDYRGEYLVRFAYIMQPEDVVFLDPARHPAFVISPNLEKIYKQGDKIGQLVFEKTQHPNLILVDNLEETTRLGGFGSTDKK